MSPMLQTSVPRDRRATVHPGAGADLQAAGVVLRPGAATPARPDNDPAPSAAGHIQRPTGQPDIGWHNARERFVDLTERDIQTLCKLYPWEWIVAEEFGRNIGRAATRWIEPMWKMLLSNKALLVVLWELYQGHPNLLPAYLDTPGSLRSYVRKPLLGREGANMEIVTEDGVRTATPGPYGNEGYVYQELCPLPEFHGEHPVLGTWLCRRRIGGAGHPRDRRPDHRRLLVVRAAPDRALSPGTRRFLRPPLPAVPRPAISRRLDRPTSIS
jgi:hypothetical protein